MGASMKFTLMVALAEVLGVILISLIVALTGKYFGGYAWDGSAKQFNLHPVLMVTGYLFFYGNSVLLYKVGAGTNVSKLTLKIAHFILHLVAFLMSVIGLIAVFQFHNVQGIANVRSLHSWIGLGTVIFYGLQLLLGFLFFLYPRPKDDIRSSFKSVHVFYGVFLLGMVVVSILTGLTEKMLFTKEGFSELSPMVLLANVFAVTVIMFSCVIAYLITSPTFSALQPDRYDQMN